MRNLVTRYQSVHNQSEENNFKRTSFLSYSRVSICIVKKKILKLSPRNYNSRNSSHVLTLLIKLRTLKITDSASRRSLQNFLCSAFIHQCCTVAIFTLCSVVFGRQFYSAVALFSNKRVSLRRIYLRVLLYTMDIKIAANLPTIASFG